MHRRQAVSSKRLGPGLLCAAAIIVLIASAACSRGDNGSTEYPATQRLSSIDSGYHAGAEDWTRFLDCWDHDLSLQFAKEEEPYRSVWRRAREAAPAKRRQTELAIADAEKRLGVKLPPSYRDFLLASDGVFLFGLNQYLLAVGAESNFVPVASLDFFRSARPDTWNDWRGTALNPVDESRYYRYGYSFADAEGADPLQLHAASFDDLIYVGDFSDEAYLLLNPKETTRDGEWEAWELNWKLPGVIRYRSFAEMIQNLYVADATDPPIGDPFPPHLLRKSCARLLPTAALNDVLGPEERWHAATAAIDRAGAGGGRYALAAALHRLAALDDARAPAVLLQYVRDPDREVWSTAIFVLGQLHARAAVAPLLDLLGDLHRAAAALRTLSRILGPDDAALSPRFIGLLGSTDPQIRSGAVDVIEVIQAKDAVVPLTRLLDGDDTGFAYDVVRALARLRDPRAIKPLETLRARIVAATSSAAASSTPPTNGESRGSAPPAALSVDDIDEAIARCRPSS